MNDIAYDPQETLEWALLLLRTACDLSLEAAKDVNENTLQRITLAKLRAERQAKVRRGRMAATLRHTAQALDCCKTLFLALRVLDNETDFANWKDSLKPVFTALGFAV